MKGFGYFAHVLPLLCTFNAKNTRSMFGSIFLHLAVHSRATAIRKATIVLIEESMKRSPELTCSIIRAGLRAELVGHAAQSAEAAPATSVQPRLAVLAQACGAIDEGVVLEVREKLVADVLVLSHHPLVCTCFFLLVYFF
jgi:hypothetical protein